MTDLSNTVQNATPEPDQADSKTRRRTILLSCFAFLTSYVITAGPVVFILEKMDLPVVAALAEIMYAPIILVVKAKIPVLSPLIKAYIGLFQ